MNQWPGPPVWLDGFGKRELHARSTLVSGKGYSRLSTNGRSRHLSNAEL